MTSLNAIQKAIFDKLAGDATLARMVTGVFDEVPQGTGFPYITIGEMTEVPFNTFDRKGRDCTVTLHIWSQYPGNKEAVEILGRMNALLDYEPLNVEGLSLVHCQFENATTIEEPDGKTRHVPVRYRVVVQG
ncbi:DUF3168 domain-containing protein [Effusibacillus pohliae]|uniref:DUF3168 domain-containing protein n=1 Tax=Effusibacillus pohliae TaxID=232270 RepID=UPI00037CDE2B|nr:DUF3168 domain-containing protein [Effusibacillus pohliae]